MAELEGNLKGVLSVVEILVKNIRRRRDLILETIDSRGCVSTKQLSLLLNTFVDKILDDSDKTSDEGLIEILAEEPHKEDLLESMRRKLTEKELRSRIKSLEDSLRKETEDKQRIQKHCSKIMEKCQTNEDNHKTQIQELNETIENLKKSEMELKSRIDGLNSRQPKFSPLIEAVKHEVKMEMIARSAIKQEAPVEVEVEPQVNGFQEVHSITDTEMESDNEIEAEDQTLKDKCLTSNLSISMGQRIGVWNESQNQSSDDVIEEIEDSSEVESIVDLTDNKNETINKSRRRRRRGRPAINNRQPYVTRGKGRQIQYVCTLTNCGFHCRYPSEMLTHILSCNPAHVPQFECHLCSMRFLMKQSLAAHMAKKHKNKSRSSRRAKGRSSKRNMKTTLLKHLG